MRENVYHDFLFNCTHFLRYQLNMKEDIASVVAKTLLNRMLSNELHYHTPIHILSIFLFAQYHVIDLEPWERLAIWFHDAIYDSAAKSGMNEAQSSAFMRAVLPDGHDVTNPMINHAAKAIFSTGDHQIADVDKKFHLIMDLDMCNFAWEASGYMACSESILKEFVPKVMTKRAFFNARRRYVDNMLKKGSFYRTNFFKERFESNVKSNLSLVMMKDNNEES